MIRTITSETTTHIRPPSDRSAAPADQVEAFLNANTFYCEKLQARIQPRQCKANSRNDVGPCATCGQKKEIGAMPPAAKSPPVKISGWQKFAHQRKETLVMSKKGTCAECKREAQIIGKGLCHICRSKAIKNGTYGEAKTVKPGQSPQAAGKPVAAAPPTDAVPKGSEPAKESLPAETALSGQSRGIKTLTITADMVVIHAIVTCLVKLDRHYDMTLRS